MHTPQVLIVGAGPAGLVTAVTLARLGVPSLVVERRAHLSQFPRATGVSLRSMELLRSWGLERHVRAGEMQVEPSGWLTQSLTATTGMPASLGFPDPLEALAVSPTTAASVPQDHLEPVLLDYLRQFTETEVEFGTELVALSQGPDGVTAEVRDRAGTRQMRFAHVVGADGAHSAVRAAAGIAMAGPDNLSSQLAVLFRAPLWEHLREHRYGLYMLQRSAPTVFAPTDNRDRWLFSMPWNPRAESLADYPDDRMVSLIRQHAGLPDLAVDVLSIGSFTFAAQIAQRYRNGRLFLAGDAAHRMTPRGGSGMNTAIADAYDLGWKLGWVHRGWAAPELLDTYEAGRRPVGLRNVRRSAIPGADRDPSQDWRDDIGGRLAHVWMPDGRSTLDLIGPGLTLLTGPQGSGWLEQAATLHGAPIEVHSLDEVTSRRLGLDPAGAVLLRPDATPARTWSAGSAVPEQELNHAVATETGRTQGGSRRTNGHDRRPASYASEATTASAS